MSDQIDTGGNTFPSAKIDDEGNIIGIDMGMTLRDHFAGLAMQSLASVDKSYNRDFVKKCGGVVQAISKQSYKMADAMIQARKEQS